MIRISPSSPSPDRQRTIEYIECEPQWIRCCPQDRGSSARGGIAGCITIHCPAANVIATVRSVSRMDHRYISPNRLIWPNTSCSAHSVSFSFTLKSMICSDSAINVMATMSINIDLHRHHRSIDSLHPFCSTIAMAPWQSCSAPHCWSSFKFRWSCPIGTEWIRSNMNRLHF